MENKDLYELPFNKYYLNKEKEIIPLKAVFSNSFCIIERKIKIKCGITLDECRNLTLENFEKVKKEFHNISLLSYEEAKIYLNTVNRLRNNSSHLFRNEPDYIHTYQFIFGKLNKDIESPYKYDDEGRLTFYGMIIILCLMLDKGYINDFFETLFSTCPEFRHYKNVKNENNAPFVTHVKTMSILTFNTKSIKTDHFQNSSFKINDVNYSYLNKLVRNLISKIIYEFEYYLASKYDFRKNRKPLSFKDLVNNEQRFKDFPDQINDLIYIRNIFFHGYWLYDEINYSNENRVLTLKSLLDICDEWKCILEIINDHNLISLIKIIDKFIYSLIHFKYSRILELTYKILNRNLFDETKVNKRIENAIKIYNDIIDKHDISNNDINRAFEIIGNEIRFKIGKQKFLDGMNRNNLLKSITILSLESNNKIKINKTITDFNNLYIVDISKYDNNLVKINDKDIKEIINVETIKINNFVNLKKIKI